jgi:2,3-diaminopropionate biosynthesis protein SbnA
MENSVNPSTTFSRPTEVSMFRAINEGILSAIGNTPLIRLKRILPDIDFKLYGKFEALNPGGSSKDRAAVSILEHGLETGLIRPNTVVIESSSGNMGIGLAQACSYLGLQFICVIDSKTTAPNIGLLRAYGAEVEIVSTPDPQTGEFLLGRIERVKSLLRSIENSFWPNQYANIYNALAHHRTMGEIARALDDQVDYVFCAASTCGTLRGCADYVREHELRTKIYAVDAVGSVIFGSPKSKRLIPGHGAAIVPGLYRPGLAARCIHVTDLDCVVGCHRLIRREAILAGGSSGGVISAINLVKDQIPPNSVCVAILADRGERYLDTVYSDSWLLKHFGEVSHLWDESVEEESCATATY